MAGKHFDRPAKKKQFSKKPRIKPVLSDERNLEVLYEDNHLIAVCKRTSDIVQGDATHDRTLDGVVKSYLKQKYNKPGDAYLGLVHRIDRPVSGVILFAKTSKALSRLTAAFRHREVSKTYWAVVQPAPPQDEGHVLNWLAKKVENNKSYAFDKPGPSRKESELRYKVVGHGDRYSFVEVYPKTGRHHQIRVTMSALGCPIKGDVKYGARRTNNNASVHLHARAIEFIHPVKREVMRVVAAPPEDLLWDRFIELDQAR
jgi:23S rRNA pseudouridine1911/1915/1917 synthase